MVMSPTGQLPKMGQNITQTKIGLGFTGQVYPEEICLGVMIILLFFNVFHVIAIKSLARLAQMFMLLS